MGEKDITEKTLESYEDVFADIINVLLFQGKKVIKEDTLTDAMPRSQYKINDHMHEMERDVAKYWKNGQIRIALLGLENQTSVDRDMPLRVIGYAGMVYRSQLLKKQEGQQQSEKKKSGFKAMRYPVVTLVLYFGYEHHWDKPLNLVDCLEIPKELKPYVNDYQVHLFEIAYLEEEQIELFQSDFRIVADYFVQMRKNKNYQPSAQTIQHVDEMLKLMSVLTQDFRFEQVYQESGRTVDNMCEVLDRIEARGIEKGIEKGKMQGLCLAVYNLEKIGYTEQDACSMVKVDLNEYQKYKKENPLQADSFLKAGPRR